MATYLDRILAVHRERAASDTRSTEPLMRAALDRDPPRDFVGALRGRHDLGVIAEIKRRSPSKGDLSADLDPRRLASHYETGGAAALSVLTDGLHFGGSADDLIAARAAVSIPVLRKDFTVCAHDVLDAAAMGADAVLLIVAALDDAELADLLSLAGEVGLAALVEAHDEAEVERALAAGPPQVIGVNQRDLVTFEVDRERAVRVAASIPTDVVAVAESGVDGPTAAHALAAAGFAAVLVGEYLVTSSDPAAALALLSVPRPEPMR